MRNIQFFAPVLLLLVWSNAATGSFHAARGIANQNLELEDSSNSSLDSSTSSVDSMIQRWPRIQEISRGTLPCQGNYRMPVMTCARLVLHQPDVVDVVSPMMDNYQRDPDQFLDAQMRGNLPGLYEFKHFPVFNDVDGQTITLGEAYRRSLHFKDGEFYFRDLQQISAYRSNAVSCNTSEQLSRYPELVAFQFDAIRWNDTDAGTIYGLASLLCLPLLNTKFVEQKLQEISDELVQTKGKVDDFLQANYPHLVEFKSMGPFDIKEPIIERHARRIMHSCLSDAHAKTILSSQEAGAKAIKDTINDLMAQKFGHCKVLHLQMKNTPVEAITFDTAIRYVANPKVFDFEKERWINEIETQLKAHDCTPKDNFALSSFYSTPDYPHRIGSSKHPSRVARWKY